MNPMVRAYLMRKRQPSKLQEEEDPADLVVPGYAEPSPVATEAPEGEGMAPEELSTYARTPLVSTAAPEAPETPAYDAAADLKAAQAQATQDDARNRFIQGGQTINDAFTHSGVDAMPASHAVADAKDRAATVRDFMLQKYRGQLGSAQQMNAQAALLNAQRVRQAPQTKAVDPLDEDKKRAEIERIKAMAAKANRLPVPKPEKGPKPPSEREKIQRERFERQKQQQEVPGFVDADPAHPHPLSEKDAEELRKSATARDFVLKQLGELENLYETHPNAAPSSAVMADMRGIIAEMQGSIAAMNDFNLTNGHQELQHAMLSDPQDLAAYLNSGRLKTQIARLRHSAHLAVETRAARMQRKENKADGGNGKVRVSNGEETLEIDPGDLDDAEADGYRRME